LFVVLSAVDPPFAKAAFASPARICTTPGDPSALVPADTAIVPADPDAALDERMDTEPEDIALACPVLKSIAPDTLFPSEERNTMSPLVPDSVPEPVETDAAPPVAPTLATMDTSEPKEPDPASRTTPPDTLVADPDAIVISPDTRVFDAPEAMNTADVTAELAALTATSPLDKPLPPTR
jgi:hypothetical protein